MRLLDLFCGAGGAAYGYHQAGFEVVGVDIEPQPNYPFEFLRIDALELLKVLPHWEQIYPDEWTFDLIHASPPCQRFSTATADADNHPDLIGATRRLLQASGLPYVIENVPAAPLRHDLTLCGSMFGLQVQRHRIFEMEGLFVWNPPTCNHEWETGRPWSVVGNAGGRKPWHLRSQKSETHSHKYKDLAHAQELMEMPWCTRTSEIVEAIPPAYTRYLGEAFLAQVGAPE